MPRIRITRTHVVRTLSAAALAVVVIAPAATGSRESERGRDRWALAPTPTVVVGYRSAAALAEVLRRQPGLVVRTIPALGVAEILPRAAPRHFASAVSHLPGIAYAEPPAARLSDAEPALLPSSTNLPGGILEWQYAATRSNAVPAAVQRAASGFTVAVVDTGADLSAPDIAAKSPVTYSVSGFKDVRDTVGHGTFVAALAAGSVTNNDGIAGFGGDAKLMVVQASRTEGTFSDLDEAAAIVWAIDHGAKIVNLSLGGPDTSTTERKAIDYAASRGALLVAAVGNEYEQDNPVEYPAALVQPVGSNGRAGVGLSVGASDQDGRRAAFSNTGSHLSLVAPGVSVLSALSSTADNGGYVKVPLPGSLGGLYGFASGTSFAAPEVAGAAALVWAANPLLTAQQVAETLKQTASNGGVWNGETGYGVIDVGAAVERAAGRRAVGATVTLRGEPAGGSRIRLTWSGTAASAYSVSVRDGNGPSRLVVRSTPRTTAVVPGVAGHSYSFSVSALDATGATVATSQPVTVAMPAARASLRLSASATAGAAPLAVDLRASLAALAGGVSCEGRPLVLEAVEKSTWREADRATTGPGCRAVWTYTLDPGVYRLRVRFPGAGDLREVVSLPVSVRVG